MEKAQKELAKYSQKVKNGETIFLFKQCFDLYNSTIGKNKQNTEAIQGKGKNFVDFPGKNQNVPSLQHGSFL
ncbi:unnamed protein product [Meloidogyne enterolobii]|uniref:Uncharacterized protein n=1 Tax=Meloidogyne enterolobii TaxID=390850 RepID=A0ACB0XX17_MELEN